MEKEKSILEIASKLPIERLPDLASILIDAQEPDIARRIQDFYECSLEEEDNDC